MTKIYLIRHAESEANTQGIYQGQTYDTQLSELGLKQVQKLRERFADVFFDIIYTSPLIRTKETAKALNGHIVETTELLETNHGDWEGKSKSEIEKNWPDHYKLWQTNPGQVTFPNGERSYQNTYERAKNWFRSILHQEGTFAVVTHTNIIQALLVYISGSELNSIWKYSIEPTGITLVERTHPADIIFINDTAHLEGIQSDLSIHAL